ncbi:MAG: hypothetical protein HKL95_11060 [Phycisphaerae bacterium]|nr:hypothetical protein [Phycisphaerae bacterium]
MILQGAGPARKSPLDKTDEISGVVLHLSIAYPLQALFKLVCEKLVGLTALHIDQQTTG